MNADLLKTITSTLRRITPEVYQGYNFKEKVVYPYITFEIEEESIERNQTGTILEMNIFDHDTSWGKTAELEDAIRDALEYRRDLTDTLNLNYRYMGSMNIPTGDEELKRRNIRYYIKTDWRTKDYGIS
jgi:hypothetical protein